MLATVIEVFRNSLRIMTGMMVRRLIWEETSANIHTLPCFLVLTWKLYTVCAHFIRLVRQTKTLVRISNSKWLYDVW